MPRTCVDLVELVDRGEVVDFELLKVVFYFICDGNPKVGLALAVL